MKILNINNNKIIKTDKYSTIILSVIFPFEDKKEYLFYIPLLKQILMNSSYEYKDEQSYKTALREKMIVNQAIYTTRYNKNAYLEFALTIPNPLKIKDYDLEGAVKMFAQTIYNPNVVDDAFDENAFKREKEFLIQDIEQGLKYVNNQAHNSFLKLVDDIGIYDNIYNNLDLIDKANTKELYEIYKKIIINNKPIITLYGDINKDIKDIIYKYFKSDDNISIDIDYNKFFIPFKETKDVTEDSKYSQSILYTAYKVENMKEEDIEYLILIKNILSYGSNDLLMKKLRQENNFIYHGRAWSHARNGLLVTEVYINNNSKDEVVKLIKELIESLKDKDFLKKCVDNEAQELYYSNIRSEDNRTKPLDDYIIKILDLGINNEERYKLYKNIDIDKLIDVVNRLSLDTIYFLRGEFDE